MQTAMKQSIKPLGSMLEDLIGSLGIKKKLSEYEAVTQWNAIVGEHIAEVTLPMRITQGVLVVRVRTSTWRNELNMRKQEIIGKVNNTIGADTVKDIRFQ